MFFPLSTQSLLGGGEAGCSRKLIFLRLEGTEVSCSFRQASAAALALANDSDWDMAPPMGGCSGSSLLLAVIRKELAKS